MTGIRCPTSETTRREQNKGFESLQAKASQSAARFLGQHRIFINLIHITGSGTNRLVQCHFPYPMAVQILAGSKRYMLHPIPAGHQCNIHRVCRQQIFIAGKLHRYFFRPQSLSYLAGVYPAKLIQRLSVRNRFPVQQSNVPSQQRHVIQEFRTSLSQGKNFR